MRKLNSAGTFVLARWFGILSAVSLVESRILTDAVLIGKWPAGNLIYEWDQNIEEVNLYIPLPEGLPSKLLSVNLKLRHIEIGVKGSPPYLNVSFNHLGIQLVQLQRVCYRFGSGVI